MEPYNFDKNILLRKIPDLEYYLTPVLYNNENDCLPKVKKLMLKTVLKKRLLQEFRNFYLFILITSLCMILIH